MQATVNTMNDPHNPFRLRRLFLNLAAAALLMSGLSAPLRAEEAATGGPTPEQVDAARQAVQSGAQLPPEAMQYLDAHPELKAQLLQDSGKKPEGEGRDKAQAKGKPKSVPPTADQAAPPPALPAYDWHGSNYLANLFGKRVTEAEAATLVHFGHDLFDPRPGVPLEDMPVSPAYVIGPGDEIVVRTWGRLEGTNRMTVDRDGRIFFPKIGPLAVAGKTLGELKSFMKGKIGAMAEVHAEVSLGDMKASRVSVIGEVRAPGWYNVSSFHTALQALSLAGGLKDIGSMRRIELRRGGSLLTSVDLYDFLLRGDNKGDIRLRQGDTIFVPVVGRTLAVVGDVRRPAIYELADEKSLQDVIRIAGGFAPSAYTRRVQVERLEGHDARIVLDVDAAEVGQRGGSFELSDGDIVRVLPIVRADENAVTLEGNVARPGKYEMKPGMTVGSLLPDEKAFLPGSWFEYAVITRTVPPDMHRRIIPVNLRSIVLEGKKDADVPLQGRDTVKVFAASELRDARKATVSGEVRATRAELQAPATVDNQATMGKVAVESKPDAAVLTFAIPEGARVSDLVAMAGGLTRTASMGRAEIIRIDSNRDFRTIYIDLGKAMAGDPNENLPIEDEDHLRIHSVWESKVRRTVTAAGELNTPGEQLMTGGMKLSDLVFKAGGLKEGAYGKEAELIRRRIRDDGSLVKTDRVVVSLEKALAGDAAADLPLREYDLLVVRQIPDWSEKVQVTLEGEVRFPGVYAVRRGEKLGSVIARAGGFTASAYAKAAQFSRASTRKSQQAAIDRLTEELELEVAQKAQVSGAALDKEDLEANKELVAARRSLIAQLKKAKATGRVIIRIPEDGKLEGSTADILVEDGDRLEIPRAMNVISVVGRVYNPTGVVFDPSNPTVGHYLRTVGGPTETADRDHMFLLRADGSVVTAGTLGNGSGFFLLQNRGLLSAKVEPGDSIVVPEKLVQTRLMKDIKDITQIMMQIAVTAGVLLRL
jgi:protein involved in polysaccharide export with SLBB domain